MRRADRKTDFHLCETGRKAGENIYCRDCLSIQSILSNGPPVQMATPQAVIIAASLLVCRGPQVTHPPSKTFNLAISAFEDG